MTLEGKEALPGARRGETFKLKVTTKSGAVRYIYLDATTYLDRRHTGVLNLPPNRQLDFVMDFGGWRSVDGVMFPFDISEDRTGREPSVSYATYTEKIELNVPMDDALFATPAGAKDRPVLARSPVAALHALLQRSDAQVAQREVDLPQERNQAGPSADNAAMKRTPMAFDTSLPKNAPKKQPDDDRADQQRAHRAQADGVADQPGAAARGRSVLCEAPPRDRRRRPPAAFPGCGRGR